MTHACICFLLSSPLYRSLMNGCLSMYRGLREFLRSRENVSLDRGSVNLCAPLPLLLLLFRRAANELQRMMHDDILQPVQADMLWAPDGKAAGRQVDIESLNRLTCAVLRLHYPPDESLQEAARVTR